MGVEVDTKAFNSFINEFSPAIKRNAAKGLRQEMKLLVRAGIMLTPPFTGTGSSGEGASRTRGIEARQSGEKNVERDIKKVFFSIDDFVEFIARFGDEKLRRRLERLARRGSALEVASLQKIWNNFKRSVGLTFVWHVRPEVHQSERRQGVIHHKVQNHLVVLQKQSLKLYLAKIKSHVGKAKAGWNTAAIRWGETNASAWPQWVRRHGSGAGSATDNLNDATGTGYLEAVNYDKAIGVLNVIKGIEEKMYASRRNAIQINLQKIADAEAAKHR